MAEGRTFGKACCTTGVLDVDGVVKLLLALALVELFITDRRTHLHQLVPVEHTMNLFRTHTNDRRQVRQFLGFELAWFAFGQFWSKRSDHLCVVGGFEGGRDYDSAAPGLFKRIFKFM